jgi:hypothetical protein
MAHKTRKARKPRKSRTPARRYLKRQATRGTRKALAKRRRATRRVAHRRPRRPQLAGSRQVLDPHDGARHSAPSFSLAQGRRGHSGVSKATICRIELGRPAKHSNLVALEQAYGLPAGSFDKCPRC